METLKRMWAWIMMYEDETTFFVFGLIAGFVNVILSMKPSIGFGLAFCLLIGRLFVLFDRVSALINATSFAAGFAITSCIVRVLGLSFCLGSKLGVMPGLIAGVIVALILASCLKDIIVPMFYDKKQ